MLLLLMTSRTPYEGIWLCCRILLERDRGALAEADAAEWEARRAVIEKQAEEARREKQRRRAQAEEERRSPGCLLPAVTALPSPSE